MTTTVQVGDRVEITHDSNLLSRWWGKRGTVVWGSPTFVSVRFPDDPDQTWQFNRRYVVRLPL